MKATELRIGNLVDSPDGICPIIEIDGYSKRATIHDEKYNDRNGYLLSTLKPVPLTEEWLVKFGFEKAEDKETYYGNGLYPIIKGIEGYWLDDYESGVINDKPVLHVHTLQNLYFALTGEELVYESN